MHLDTVGTPAETLSCKRMRMVLESQNRALHNRMHELGSYHDHTQSPIIWDTGRQAFGDQPSVALGSHRLRGPNLFVLVFSLC